MRWAAIPWRWWRADLNGDGRPDLVVGNSNGSDTVSVLVAQPGGGFSAPTNYPVASSPQELALGDINGDGHPDLAVTGNISNTRVGDVR